MTANSKGDRYEIEKITDIFAIPEERFNDFLADFKAYYLLGKSTSQLLDSVAAVVGIKSKSAPGKMVWIDDGKHDVRAFIKPEATPTTKGAEDEQPQ